MHFCFKRKLSTKRYINDLLTDLQNWVDANSKFGRFYMQRLRKRLSDLRHEAPGLFKRETTDKRVARENFLVLASKLKKAAEKVNSRPRGEGNAHFIVEASRASLVLVALVYLNETILNVNKLNQRAYGEFQTLFTEFDEHGFLNMPGFEDVMELSVEDMRNFYNFIIHEKDDVKGDEERPVEEASLAALYKKFMATKNINRQRLAT